ncbi:helix-turn-helix transcriptional regulator [Nocardioides taihuensis]|uniref:Helix-turn-helix transcriptional regulator n=1 Tax=Nocardioides taihuensis TaxID=1835606 RepID=A0ABW0BKL1_9ACTN
MTQNGDRADGPPRGRDRLRELLDAVLDDDHHTLGDMAEGAYASPFHFSRTLTRDAGEPPVAMRRRVMLERAAWQLRGGASVTDVAFASGYDSVEGFSRAFSRAFGHVPSQVGPDADHWLPSPNGIHFHPPTSLWIDSRGRSGTRSTAEVTAMLVHHDLDDTAALLDAAKALDEDAYRRVRAPGRVVLWFEGPEETVAALLERLVFTKEVWLASIEGRDAPTDRADDLASLVARHAEVGPRWLAMVRDIDRRDAWGDRLVDALCEPPESFVLGSVLAHVITFSAVRRQLVRELLRTDGVDVGHGDPIDWLRSNR